MQKLFNLAGFVGGTVILIAAGVLFLMWNVFPWMVYWQFREIRRLIQVATKAAAATSAPRTAEPQAIKFPPIPGTERYWVAMDGKPVGPRTADEIRSLLARGTIERQTFVYREGSDGWVCAENV